MKTHALRPSEHDQLKQLRDRLGITKLARALDLPFYACRSMLDFERVSDRTLQRVRDHLPDAFARHITTVKSERAARAVEHRPLRRTDVDVQSALASLLPYASIAKLAHSLGLSLNTVRAAAAGYRLMHASTAEALRDRLDELLEPPYIALRATLRTPPVEGVIDGLRNGVLTPIYGLSIAETEALLRKAESGAYDPASASG